MNTPIFRCIILYFLGFITSTCFGQIHEGSYAGVMQLVPTTMGMDSVPVQLDIIRKNDTVYQLKMTYDSTLTKDYKLILNGDKIVLDENNGIQLPGAQIANTFIFHYAVNEQQYHSSYEIIDSSSIHFRLSYYKPSNSVQSDDFTIRGYKKAGHQYVLLRKIE